MREVLADVLKHATSLGFLDTIKITGTNDSTTFESMTEKQEIVFKAYLKEPIVDFEGEFGMTNLSVIKGLTDFSSFKADGASVSVKREKRQGREIPVELIFSDAEGRTACYRFTPPDLVPNQPRLPPVKWDVTFKPQKAKIQELQQLSGIFSVIDPVFNVKTVEDELRFYIGDENSANHRTYVVMEKPCNGKMDRTLPWTIPHLMSVLKLFNDSSNAEISIISRGFMRVTFETAHANYDIMLPAKKNN
jgi:hypothetical protein